jgi:acyl-[acyl-carrier-protein]-phospholipid O-acyltransferase/long-chain-fatty-acid--[acyl-carrier-protein] ligase
MPRNVLFNLLTSRRFAPLLATQFLGAFHDNIFKNAFVVLILYEATVDKPAIVATLAAAIFILPFVLFSALGGELADKFSKHHVIRATKIAEIPIAVLGAVAITSSDIHLSYITLFLLGSQSALFGPSRYAIMPEHLDKKELVAANGLISACVFISILMGTIIGTALITQQSGKIFIISLLFICAFAGTFFSFLIPSSTAYKNKTILNFNPLSKTPSIIQYTLLQPHILSIPVLGIGWFYFMGSLFLSQFPNYARSILFVDEMVLTLFLSFFTIGIAFGGLCNAWLLRTNLSMHYIPLALAGISVFSTDLYFASYAFGSTDNLLGLSGFLSHGSSLRILFDIFIIAVCGGLFQVPLNALLQQRATPDQRSRLLAGSAAVNSLFIITSSIFAAVLLSVGITIHALFAVLAIMNTAALILFLKHRKKMNS